MITGRLAEAAETVRGTVVGPDATFTGLSTDTRTLQPGELFVALDGPNFSGREFVPAAGAKAAAGAVVSGTTADDLPQIDVADSRIALGALAARWRRDMNTRIVGLTGSNGKTTLKELIASCLSRAAKTLATHGNLNNDIGVPLMLSRLAHDDEFAVIEMGANHAGEIAYLTDLTQPEVVAITNAGAAHLEGFGSIEGVAKAKGEILLGSRRPDFAILNADDAYFEYWRSSASDVPVLSFGTDSDADVRVDSITEMPEGVTFTLHLPSTRVGVRLPLAGRHNALNAAAAAAVATALDISPDVIVAGLEAVEPVGGRLQPVQIRHDVALFDDSYNANPDSVLAAVNFLSAQAGRRWLVLGDMAELGTDAAAMHEEIGRRAQAAGVDRLFATGRLCQQATAGFGAGAHWYESVDALGAALIREIEEHDGPLAVLVKGSRSMGMERVVASAKRASAEQDG